MVSTDPGPAPTPDRVEARFYCADKRAIDQQSVAVDLRASISGMDNTNWAPYTPSGQISMTVNGPAGASFVEGGRYRVVFERVGPDE